MTQHNTTNPLPYSHQAHNKKLPNNPCGATTTANDRGGNVGQTIRRSFGPVSLRTPSVESESGAGQWVSVSGSVLSHGSPSRSALYRENPHHTQQLCVTRNRGLPPPTPYLILPK
ncbi:hypothetical protein CEXT_169171 [Caerostris extrusa]|uniref:Uncharacterized protein n=1 Tax=Caerostris extrusa TaxID=172846 RepID=A0AAV4VLY7_CAEEX|nr:hypothetical protein CEXT_169171 [Caerostris extrusa]